MPSIFGISQSIRPTIGVVASNSAASASAPSLASIVAQSSALRIARSSVRFVTRSSAMRIVTAMQQRSLIDDSSRNYGRPTGAGQVAIPSSPRPRKAHLLSISVNHRRGPTSAQRPERPVLALDQRPLAPHAPAIARDPAPLLHHPVAGHHDREVVRGASLGNLAGVPRRTDPGRDLTIGGGLS